MLKRSISRRAPTIPMPMPVPGLVPPGEHVVQVRDAGPLSSTRTISRCGFASLVDGETDADPPA